MSDLAVEARWVEDQKFEAMGGGGVAVALDGRRATGPSPMEALLIGLATCMGADVVDILTKGRVGFDGLVVRAEGDRRRDPPRRYTAVRLTYEVSGMDGEADGKLQRAVELSRDRYCSVLHSLDPDIEVSIEVEAG
jgi:putative redox protein